MSGRAANLQLTRRALRDLFDIAEYSRNKWGDQTAESYLNDLEAGLDRLKEQPDLLITLPELPSTLVSYQVNRHLLICDVDGSSIVVVAVLHASMDLFSRLAELERSLANEVHLLHEKALQRKSKQRRNL